VRKKSIKNSQPFGKKFQKTVGGDFFDSHCRLRWYHRAFLARGRQTRVEWENELFSS